MKKIKTIISVVLIIVLTFSVNITVNAADKNACINHKTIKTNGYSFDITEKNNNYVITRTYTKDSTSNPSTTDLNETKALLVSLGMNNETVDELSVDTLQTFSESLNIVVTTSYTKYDEENNVATEVPETVAIAEANKIQLETQAVLLQKSKGDLTLSANATGTNASDKYQDSYMKVIHTAAYKGSGSYLFSVDAEWLSMPVFRGYDSIGSCAMNCTVTSNTEKGYYSYTRTIIDNLGNITTKKSDNITITKKQNAVKGNWYGSAGIFNLPNDYSDSYSNVTYTGLKAHYEYKGHVSQPNQENWFNTVGTYDHATVGFNVTPAIEIDFKGNTSASIGLDSFAVIKSRSVELEIHYVP